MDEKGFLNKVIQINNTTNLIENEKVIKGSLIDIDILYPVSSKDIDLNQIINVMHDEEKKLFFNLLKPNLLKKLKPIF
jgi:uncharacterized protein (TIGR04255 family)